MVVCLPSWCLSGNPGAIFCQQCGHHVPSQFFAMGSVFPMLHCTAARTFIGWLAPLFYPDAKKQISEAYQLVKLYVRISTWPDQSVPSTCHDECPNVRPDPIYSILSQSLTSLDLCDSAINPFLYDSYRTLERISLDERCYGI